MSSVSMSERPVKVRFSPSPTGYFHVGGARTALWNWLFARQRDAEFVLRIEDTDAERNRPEWVEGIQSAMRWLGLDWDGEPAFQSQRGELYRDAVDQVLSKDLAYWCRCSRDEIDARAKARGGPPGYDGYCRDLGLQAAEGSALRFRTPRTGVTTVIDVIRGTPEFENSTIEDFVIQRANGSPLFILANAVDDLDMRITHVIRGEEHLPNTPKYLLLWEALDGGEPPIFAHVPVLVNEKRQKLSKRRDKVALEDYRDQGYLAGAMRNYLVLLGWSPGDDRELLSVDEMVELFRLEDINSSPAFFDEKKLLHFNGEYIRAMSLDDFINASERFLSSGPWRADDFDGATFRAVASLVQERVKLLTEVPGYVEFLFLPEAPIDDRAWEKRVVNGQFSREILQAAIRAFEMCAWEADALHEATASVGEQHGLGLGKAQFPVRVAVTGKDVGPPLFESLVVLGRERTLARLGAALARLG